MYILIDENKLAKENTVFINGYFTLSNKVMHLPNTISKNLKKRLFKGLPINDDIMHFILIGQLGKYIEKVENGIRRVGNTNASELLDSAFEIIHEVKERIPCNCVLIECKDEDNVKDIYRKYGFTEFQRDGNYIQFIKFI